MERFTFADQQRRSLTGESPDSMESHMMRSLLGDKPRQQGLEPYQGVSTTHQHVDELQVGRSLGHHILSDMVQAEVSLSTLLPFQDVNPSLSYFEWTIERFRPGIAPLVPEEAPFAELQFAKEPRYVKIQRRGAAVRMTANIMNTTEGMARLQNMILKLGATVLTTVEQLMIQTLVTAHDGPMYRRKMTLDKYGDREFGDQLHYDAARFSSWNRNPDVEAANDMSDVAKLLGEFTPGPYAVLYPAGRQAVLGGQVLETAQGLTVKTMNAQKQILQLETPKSQIRMADGSLAFAVPDYSYGRGSTRMQPLLRATMIGEHFPMTGVRCDDLAWRVGVQLPGGGFATCQRDIMVYDTEQDQYEKVAFEEAFRRSMFVAEFGDDDPVAAFVGAGSRLTTKDFDAPRAAPSRVYWENGPKAVKRFAEFDPDVVPAGIHRRVGNTVAAAVHAASGGDISDALSSGFQLLRELAQAPFDQGVLDALAVGNVRTGVAPAFAGTTTYAVAAPDLIATYGPGMGGISAVTQDPTGAPALTAGAPTQNLVTAINKTSTPPFMLSLGGLRLLAKLAVTDGTRGRALELGARARDLLEAAEKIYSVVKDKFPDAVALNPAYRPLNHLPADGFATFFAAVFLNSGNLPLLYRTAVGAPWNVTPLVVSQATQAQIRTIMLTDPAGAAPGTGGDFGLGDSTNPLVPTTDAARFPLLTQRRFAKAHTRTPWAAQHAPFAAALAQQGLRGRGARRRPQPEPLGMEEEEEDLFGTSPTFRAQSQPAGAAIDGAPNIRLRRTTIAATIAPGAAGPLASTNAQNAWNAADGIDEPLVRVCTMVYLSAPCGEMRDYRRMMEANILIPFDVLLVRPALELDMYSVVVMKPGLDTGFHAVADTVLDFGKDVDHQTRKITFSIRHATVLKAPDHVAILPSRMARRYVAGGGVKLYTSPDELDRPGEQRPDLIAFVVPMDHKVHRVEPAGGRDVDGRYGAPGSSRFPDANMYERMWNLSEQAMATREQGERYYDSASVIPDYTWRGEFTNYDRTIRYPAQGHRRGGSHPGCRDVWDANEAVFPEPPAGMDTA